MCSGDNVPAATLLVPYFEVDLSDPEGASTILSLHNTWPEPTLVQVTLWTDWAQPTLSFQLFLTGFDTTTFDLRTLFANGSLPVTADEQTDPLDTISPRGNNPEWDGSFAGCGDFFPYVNPVLSSSLIDLLVNGHTGQPVAIGDGECAGSSHGDNIARGYVTLDDVSRCNLLFPTEEGYFGGNDPVATTDNQLAGDFIYFNSKAGTSIGSPMVHIEADPNFDPGSTGTGYTFYGTYTAPDGDDYREPLGQIWGVPYRSFEPEGSADWVVWRDSTSADTARFYPCDGGPSWYPLETTELLCWSEQEDVLPACFDGDCLPLQTQRVTMGSDNLFVPFNAGWCRLDLAVSDEGVVGDVDFPDSGGTLAQSWVGSLSLVAGYAGGFSSVVLRSAGLIPPELFEDDFETGDTTAWSLTSP